MLKKQTAVIFLAIIVLFGASCQKKEPGRYYNKKHSFSIKFPAGWEINEGDKNTVVLSFKTNVAPEEVFPPNINIVAGEISDGMNLESFLKMQVNGIKEKLNKITGLENGFTKIDKKDAAWVSYIYKIGDVNLIAKSYFIISNKNVYTITFVAVKTEYQKNSSPIDDSIASFRLE